MTTPSTAAELVDALTRDPTTKLGNAVAARKAIDAFAEAVADRASRTTLAWAAAHAQLRSTDWRQADNPEAWAALTSLGCEFDSPGAVVAAREARRP